VADIPDSSFAVLGLVDKVPSSSGYKLTSIAEQSFAYFWPISRTLLYRELKRLERLGWIAGTPVRQESAPDKRTYDITGSGRRALAHWLGKPTETATTFRSGFLLKLFFGLRMHPPALAALLTDYRRSLEAQRDQLTEIVDRLEGLARARVARLAALHGLRTAQARLAWLDEAEAELREPG
jgi:DNA-binding PadR family transcriptional regulator